MVKYLIVLFILLMSCKDQVKLDCDYTMPIEYRFICNGNKQYIIVYNTKTTNSRFTFIYNKYLQVKDHAYHLQIHQSDATVFNDTCIAKQVLKEYNNTIFKECN